MTAATDHDAPTAQAWSALGGPLPLLDGVTYHRAPGALPARLPVLRLARATVGVCSLAAAELLAVRNGGAVPALEVDEAAVATAFVSERQLRIDGRALTAFAPLSGFWRTADGWVRTHANYPHHRERLLAALGTTPERFGAELAGRAAVEVQETAYAAGALAVAVREPRAGDQPLVERGSNGPTAQRLAPAPLPATGVRVLDLTRVIAGPVATRTLALLGADVLRIDSPRLPESEDAHADTGFGKRSALLDLDRPADLAVLRELIATADVVVTGYRPGALERYGLLPDGVIVARLRAWDRRGPWADRRGFDSLVQAGCGIAAIEASPDGHPGALPAQALDHGTGYLLAAGVLRALTERQQSGRATLLRHSLAGTAQWLLGMDRETADGEPGTPTPRLAETPSPYGLLRHARPPIGYAGAPATWASGPTRWGSDYPAWTTGS
ncbi:crotonobetainyl-CoA:carnitine CoA-transferase CaiB-like acyl-CoA transferase [Kitasatospora sp. GAS204A]|uniref:CoA transferase n=1 Tax=unclassified Kitasatospora TaxID=2633591 RepID=UPI0024740A33|nr:CoA transferase [Kitasatospora sp. GAS204B]MDH6119463.1 crotonobetainyl-CoA:carnitine CoA-transferase CaiB-like acyl-CoA transferase [Kitasatospora sp. GAS204B]